MKLDSEEQRQLLLGIMENINVPGKLIDMAYSLKKSIETAELETTIAKKRGI